ncbi:MAG: hypothetical protein SVK54_07610, partial [candidate division WOR-3 bacterium]|nr:hypothetical protein [candidate division WOR-3 bacterium]
GDETGDTAVGDVYAVESGDQVFVTGMKGVSINVSDRGSMDLNQSLELSIDGNVDKRWDIEGFIYDNSSQYNYNSINIPVSEIDNMRLSVKDSSTMIVLGNTAFEGFDSRFTARTREMLGILGSTNSPGFEISAAAAGQKGRLKTTEFYCNDGVQGPYTLVDEIVLSEYIITPGSEQIYLNGNLLKIGEDNDYTFNYQTGELTFTQNNIVDSDDYVYAQFQTYENSGPMTGYYCSVGSENSPARLLFMREQQDVTDADMKDSLSRIEGDSGTVFISDYHYVGAGNGDYTMEDSIFVYSGAGNGDYNVQYSFVGYKNGSYIYNSADNSYVFAGMGNGSYSPGRTLTLPFESNYIAGDFKYSFLPGVLTISTGGGFYKYNRFNPDASYTKDISYEARFMSKQWQTGEIMMQISAGYALLSDFYRSKWMSSDIEQISHAGDIGGIGSIKNNTDIIFDAQYSKYIKGRFQWSRLDSISSRALRLSADSVMGFSAGFTRRHYSLTDSTLRDYTGIDISRQLRAVKPAYTYEYELKNNMTYKRHTAAVSSELWLARFIMENRMRKDTLENTMYAVKSGFNGNIVNQRIAMSAEYRLNRRMRDMTTDNRLYARLNIDGNSKYVQYNGGIRLSSVSRYKEVESYVYTGPGRGEYVYDSLSNEYIYDEYEGEYVKITENIISDNAVASREGDFALKADINMFKYSFDMNYGDDIENVFSFSAGDRQSEHLTIMQNADYEINQYIVPFWTSDMRINNRMLNASYSAFSNNIGISSTGSELIYKLYYRNENDRRSNLSGSYSSRDINTGNLELFITNSPFTYRIELLYGNAEIIYYDLFTDTIYPQITLSKLEFDLGYRFSRNMRISLNPGISLNTYNDAAGTIPAVLTYTYPEGIAWTGNVSVYWNNDIININMRYSTEFTGERGFRQKGELGFYTYF